MIRPKLLRISFASIAAAVAATIPVPFGGLALAQSDGAAVTRISRAVAEDMVVEAIGKHPLGVLPVAGYKVVDFLIDIGDAAVDKKDETRGAELVLMRADAALLKSLVARGQGYSPQAQDAKVRLHRLSDRLNSGDAGKVDYLLGVVRENLEYGVAKASAQRSLEMGLGKLLGSDPIVRFVSKYVHFGHAAASVVGNRSALRPVMAHVGWRKFGTRAAVVERYVDRATDGVLDEIVGDAADPIISGMADGAIDPFFLPLVDHRQPIAVARAVSYERRIPAARAVQNNRLFTRVIASPPRIWGQRVTAMPSQLGNWESRASGNLLVQSAPAPGSSGGASQRPGSAPPRQPDYPTAEDIARDARLRQAFSCAGAGNKAGCGSSSFDGDEKSKIPGMQ